MPDTPLDSLIHACLDGRASDHELAELEERLASDAAARDRYLALADLHACLAIDESLWQLPATGTADTAGRQPGTRPRGAASFSRTVAAAAVGLLVGLCGAGLAFGYVLPGLSQPLVIFADGFESGPLPESRGLVARPGRWSGDTAQVVPTDQGVPPAEGRQMLRLLRADYPGKLGADSYIADCYRLIDLRPCRELLATGQAVARVSARCNATGFPADEEYMAGIAVLAFDTPTVDRLEAIPNAALAEQALAMTQRRNVEVDRQPGTWQPIDCELRLPSESDFLLLRLSVAHQHPAQRRPSFPGHYLDDVVVTLDPSRPAVQP